jgi:rhodanese-related sulfurtransferase
LDKNSRVTIVALVAILIVFSAYYLREQGSNASYGEVSVQQARILIDDKPDLVILDVRTEVEFSEGHIERSINIPVQELEQRLSELNANDEFLVYCRTGNRSATATGIMKENGYKRIYHMTAGITAWTAAGYSTVKSQ